MDGSDEEKRARLEAILELYADAGLPAFPLLPATKKPHTERWQEKATDHGLRLYRRLAHFPGCNVGLVMGGEVRPGEFAFALDVDPRKGGKRSFGKLLGMFGLPGLPETAEAATGGAGRHFVMTAPFPVKCGDLDANLPGLELKGVGGYIVAEPSIHPETGKEYVWIRAPRRGIARAPAGLADVLPVHGGPARHAGAGGPGDEGAGGATRRAEPTRVGDASAWRGS